METITEQIPESLLVEEFGGRKYYRRGYREVVSGLKDEDEIKWNNLLHGLIISAVLFDLKVTLPKEKYWMFLNETGEYFGGNESFVNDISIIEKSKVNNPFSSKPNDLPPKFIIELDLKIDPADYFNPLTTGSEMAYMVDKSKRLTDFGVEDVAWILTESRKILLMRPNRRLEIFEWSDDVPLFDSYTFCLQTILEEEDIIPPTE